MERCPVCKTPVRPSDKFCGMCRSPLARDASPVEDPPPGPTVEAAGWVPPAESEAEPERFVRSHEPIELPPDDETPEPPDEPENDVLGFFETADPTPDELRAALSRLRGLARGVTEAEVRRKLSWFDRGRGPNEALVTWFTTMNGGDGFLLSIDAAVEARRMFSTNTYDGWEHYRRRTDFLPLAENGGGDTWVYDVKKGRRGVIFHDHEVPSDEVDTESLLDLVEQAAPR